MNYAAGTDPTLIRAADLGNGQVDLVVTNPSVNGVSVLLGTGTGSFQAPSTYALTNTPAALFLANLGNGHLDVLTLNSVPTQFATFNSVSVLVGNGDGTLQSAVDYNAGDRVTGVSAVDLGNGHTDLVLVDLNQEAPQFDTIPGTVSVLLGDGNGAFQTASSSPVGPGPTQAIAADVTSDGNPDLIVDDGGSNAVSILVSHGDGTFQAANTYAVSAAAPGPIVTADFNGDGRQDLAVASTTTGALSILFGNGDGTFVAGPTLSLASARSSAWSPPTSTATTNRTSSSARRRPSMSCSAMATEPSLRWRR